MNLSPYKLTIVAAIVVLCLAVAVLSILGPNNTGTYIAFLTPTVAALLALLKAEQNSAQNSTQHEETLAQIAQLKQLQEISHPTAATKITNPPQ